MVDVTAAIVGVSSPARVAVTVEDLVIGTQVQVIAISRGEPRMVRGGGVEASSTQLVLVDDLATLNSPTTYEVMVDGTLVATSDPVVVPWTAGAVVQSVDGAIVVPVRLEDNADPRALAVVQNVSRVPGRRHPVVRWDMAGGYAGTWQVRTMTPQTTLDLRELLAAGGPVVLRTASSAADYEPVLIVVVSAAANGLIGTLPGRRWVLSWVEVDDPLADTVIASDLWMDVDAAYEGDELAELDDAYAGTQFGDWNRTDWVTLGA